MAYLGKVSTVTQVADNAVTTAKIFNGSVTAPKIASLTSAELITIISDETGSGSLTFATSPTFAGTPQAPTATIGTANAMVATTAFVSNSPVMTNAVINYGTIRDSVLESAFERANVINEAATGNIVFDLLDYNSLYFTANATSNVSINFRGNATTTLNSAMTNLQNVVSAVLLITTGGTPFYPNNVMIDGTVVHSATIKGNLYWQSNIVVPGGYPIGIDAYTFNIIKRGTNSYTILATQNQFKSFLT